MTRTRSEYRATIGELPALPAAIAVGTAHETDREVLATLLLDAYRGTIDDEGEDHDDALAAIDHYLGIIQPEMSVVLYEDGQPVAMSFVLRVDDRAYIDPVVSRRKGRGLGTAAVAESLRRLQADGVHEVGATITDGNTPSERLFASLGFERVGPWPR